MFCHKCGHKSIDGAAFCQKCGAKMIKDQSEAQISAEPVIVSPETATPLTEPRNISTAEPVQQASAAPVPTGIQEACNRLKGSAEHCPKIKKIAVSKGAMGTSVSTVLIYGFFNKYTYTPGASVEKASISWGLKLALYSVYIPILLCDALFLAFFFQGEYYPVLTICCLIGCILWFPFLFFAYMEKKEIIAHVNETFGCKIKVPSKVPLVISYVLNLIQIGLCIAALVIGFGSSSDVPAAASNNPVSHTVENVSLSQTYANEDEGFSFMYPDDWTIREDSMMAAVLAPAESGYNASITIMKSDADETYFTATMPDLETMYS